MIIKSIAVTDFRNHAQTVLHLSPGINVLTGDNAQGKTNILEAVYLTCVGRTWRTSKECELVSFGKRFASVKTSVTKKFGDCSVEVVIEKPDAAVLNNSAKQAAGSIRKYIKVNGIPVSKMGELMGTVNCVFFSPDELRLIKEAPSDRRRFMDMDISQIDKSYFYSLIRYNKILLQRNALLKQLFGMASLYKAPEGGKFQRKHSDELSVAQKNSSVFGTLDTWDAQLANIGAKILVRRMEFVKSLKKGSSDMHKRLTDTKEDIDILYVYTGVDIDTLHDTDKMFHVEHFEDMLLTALRLARDKDVRMKTTTVGPHRDDLRILINGRDTRTLASQGQQRTAALAVKLAELDIFKEVTGEVPILLLDDVFSELDARRQNNLLAALSGCQSVITTTKMLDNLSVKIFKVNNGTVCD